MLTQRNQQEGTRAADDTQPWEITLGASVGNVERAMFGYPAKSWVINTDLFAASRYN
jgi:hypothetical protein